MAIGPILFWCALLGLLFFIYLTIKKKFQPEHTLLLTLFIINMILFSQAGRFINDLVPYMAIFASYLVLLLLQRCHLSTTLESKSFLFQDIRWYHILSPIGIFLVILFPFVELPFLLWNIYFISMLLLSTIPLYKIFDNLHLFPLPTKVLP
jgi:asparagine N-glycosylation enzyme membrane subunit Stt3